MGAIANEEEEECVLSFFKSYNCKALSGCVISVIVA